MSIKKGCKNTFVLVIPLLLLISCSLDYFEQEDSESTSPEFVFFDTTFNRIENNKLSLVMDVAQVEQYSEGGLMFAKQPNFTLYDSNEKVSAIGFCDTLSANTERDEYTFYGNVSIISYENDARIEAENLRWNGDMEMFSGAIGESVLIFVGGNNVGESGVINENSTELIVEGQGFSASGVDFSYSFSGPVSGSIIEN